MTRVDAEIWGEKTDFGRLIMSREGEIMTLVAPDEGQVWYLPMASFKPLVHLDLLAKRAAYARAVAEGLDFDLIDDLQQELIGYLTQLTPIAAQGRLRVAHLTVPVGVQLTPAQGIAVLVASSIFGGVLIEIFVRALEWSTR